MCILTEGSWDQPYNRIATTELQFTCRIKRHLMAESSKRPCWWAKASMKFYCCILFKCFLTARSFTALHLLSEGRSFWVGSDNLLSFWITPHWAREWEALKKVWTLSIYPVDSAREHVSSTVLWAPVTLHSHQFNRWARPRLHRQENESIT